MVSTILFVFITLIFLFILAINFIYSHHLENKIYEELNINRNEENRLNMESIKRAIDSNKE